jgi:hypothetical protein
MHKTVIIIKDRHHTDASLLGTTTDALLISGSVFGRNRSRFDRDRSQAKQETTSCAATPP